MYKQLTGLKLLSEAIVFMFINLNVSACIAPWLVLRSHTCRSGNKPAIKSHIHSHLWPTPQSLTGARYTKTTVYNDLVPIQDRTPSWAAGEGLFDPPNPDCVRACSPNRGGQLLQPPLLLAKTDEAIMTVSQGDDTLNNFSWNLS